MSFSKRFIVKLFSFSSFPIGRISLDGGTWKNLYKQCQRPTVAFANATVIPSAGVGVDVVTGGILLAPQERSCGGPVHHPPSISVDCWAMPSSPILHWNCLFQHSYHTFLKYVLLYDHSHIFTRFRLKHCTFRYWAYPRVPEDKLHVFQ